MTGELAGEEPYLGCAWRSRYLRAPKVALELAERTDFAPIGELAHVSLGLKTGADKFFFLKAIPVAKNVMAELGLKSSDVFVEGFENWRGAVARSDVLPALVGPHSLFLGDGQRRFSVPANTGRLYLYPRAGRFKAQLKDYVALAELAGVPLLSLVAQNGVGGDWYRQNRPLIRDRWALPYNSAYDYGAWDNGAKAVLNGRFVGARARDDVTEELLGAVLNSTFAMIGRLVEGMATGTEGAFDAGPPAIRRIMVPDVRRFTAKGVEDVLEVMADIRRSGVMPAAPSVEGTVPALRQQLDTELLVAGGLSRGKAAALTDRLYSRYARWRRDVEAVERQMRGFRREMSRNGQDRSLPPAEVAGRRIWEEVAHSAKLFPSGLLMAPDEFDDVRIPRSAVLPEHPRLIDPGLIVHGTEAIDLTTHSRVRYAAMLRRIGFSGDLCILKDSEKAASIATLFEQQEAVLRRDLLARATGYIGAEGAAEAAEFAIRAWLKACREAGMRPVERNSQATPVLEAPIATGV